MGQTVNSYKHVDGERTTRLSDLLYQLHDQDGLDRIKFVTNYPRDMSHDLLAAVCELPKCSPYLHVPAQSGSDRILKRMKRGYTVGEYREMIARIRDGVPDAAVTSDFIVGFCGETEQDYQQTVNLVNECRFKNSFIFKYSVRPGTKGAQRYADDIPDEEKRRRNNHLLAVQKQISDQENQSFLGRIVDVLVEGPSKAAAKQEQKGSIQQLTGRTHCDRIVVFPGNKRQVGQILPVAIYDATAFTLFGSVVTQHIGPDVYTLQAV